MLTKTKKILDKIFDTVPPGELALLTVPFAGAFFSEPPWYVFFLLSLGMWIVYGTFTFLSGLLLPPKFRFSVRDVATRPLSSFLELIVMRIPLSVFEPHVCDTQDKKKHSQDHDEHA